MSASASPLIERRREQLFPVLNPTQIAIARRFGSKAELPLAQCPDGTMLGDPNERVLALVKRVSAPVDEGAAVVAQLDVYRRTIRAESNQ